MHRRPLLLLTTALALGALSVTALPAQAAKPDAAPRRAVSSVTFEGTGYGHGRGLSQYGARNRAEAGQGYRTIVKHYYPGTRWGSATGNVSVLISGDTTTDVQVGARSGLTARSLGARKTWRLPTRRAGKVVQRWRITPAGHRSTISYRTHSWHTWRTAAGDAQFAAGGRAVRLYVPGGSVQYRGTLRSASANARGTARDTVNILPLDSYLKGVVPREMPGSWKAAAVRAQAVAARTYAAFERAAAPRTRHYQVCDTAHCQVYGGYSAEYHASNDAVVATARQVLTYGGKPAFTQFSASNGGYSVAGEQPYLTAAPDPYDHGVPGDPWERTFTARQITSHWDGLGDLVSITVEEREGADHEGHVTTVRVRGTRSSVRVGGSTLQSWLGLRSSMFTITPS